MENTCAEIHEAFKFAVAASQHAIRANRYAIEANRRSVNANTVFLRKLRAHRDETELRRELTAAANAHASLLEELDESEAVEV